MAADALDHIVIHVADWDRTHGFYVDVLGLERVENPEAAGNPLDTAAYRVGGIQINVHGPWPGQQGQCCPPPFNEIGRSDLAFATSLRPDEVVELFERNSIAVVAGPVRRFGASGWGTSIYCHDPSGNGVELISYHSSSATLPAIGRTGRPFRAGVDKNYAAGSRTSARDCSLGGAPAGDHHQA